MAARVVVRPWTRRDRRTVAHWTAPSLPEHWMRVGNDTTLRLSYAIDELSTGELIGRLTLRNRQETSAWIGIYLRPDCYSRGFGREALNLIGNQLRYDLWADVAVDNVRSLKAFRQAFFVSVSLTERQGYWYVTLLRSYASATTLLGSNAHCNHCA